MVKLSGNTKPSNPKGAMPIGESTATRFVIVSEEVGENPQDMAQVDVSIVDALSAITKKLESLLEQAKSKSEKQPAPKKLNDGIELGVPGDNQLVQATEIAVELVSFLVKFGRAPIESNFSLNVGNDNASDSELIDGNRTSTSSGKSPMNLASPLVTQLQKALVVLRNAAEFSGQNSAQSKSGVPLLSGLDSTSRGGEGALNESPLRALLGAVKLLEDIIGQESNNRKPVARPFSQNISLLAGGAEYVAETKPDIRYASTAPAPSGLRSSQQEGVSFTNTSPENPNISKKNPDFIDRQSNAGSTKRTPATGKFVFGNLDPRVLNVLSLISSKAGLTFETGGQNAPMSGTEDFGSKQNLIAFSATSFSPSPLISEQELAMVLNATNRSDTASINSPIEGTQSSRFASAIARQIKSAFFSLDRTVIQLSPNGLGTIQIEIETDDDGALKVVLRAENMSVLNTLRQERDTVLQALSLANLNGNTTDLEFREFDKQSQSHHGPNVDSAKLENGQDGAEDISATTYSPLIARDHLDILA